MLVLAAPAPLFMRAFGHPPSGRPNQFALLRVGFEVLLCGFQGVADGRNQPRYCPAPLQCRRIELNTECRNGRKNQYQPSRRGCSTGLHVAGKERQENQAVLVLRISVADDQACESGSSHGEPRSLLRFRASGFSRREVHHGARRGRRS